MYVGVWLCTNVPDNYIHNVSFFFRKLSFILILLKKKLSTCRTKTVSDTARGNLPLYIFVIIRKKRLSMIYPLIQNYYLPADYFFPQKTAKAASKNPPPAIKSVNLTSAEQVSIGTANKGARRAFSGPSRTL